LRSKISAKEGQGKYLLCPFFTWRKEDAYIN